MRDGVEGQRPSWVSISTASSGKLRQDFLKISDSGNVHQILIKSVEQANHAENGSKVKAVMGNHLVNKALKRLRMPR